MCDPLTLAMGTLSLITGAAASDGAPPAAELPATATIDAKEDTGADVILGGDRDSDNDEDETTSTITSKTTSGTGLNSNSKSSGINIL